VDSLLYLTTPYSRVIALDHGQIVDEKPATAEKPVILPPFSSCTRDLAS